VLFLVQSGNSAWRIQKKRGNQMGYAAKFSDFYGSQQVSVHSNSAYSKRGAENEVTLSVDARKRSDDSIEIQMVEFRTKTNRTTGISMSLTRAEWEQFKANIEASIK
jgi:hypothetical protein